MDMSNPEEMFEAMDPTRKARKEALDTAEQVLHRAAKGAKIDRKDTIKAIKGLYVALSNANDLMAGLLADLFKVVQAIAANEVNIFSANTKVKAITELLEKKEVLTEAELQEQHDNVTVPKIMEDIQQQQAAAAEKKKDD